MRKNFAPAHFMEGFKPFTVRAMRSNIDAMRSNIGAMRSNLGAIWSNLGAMRSKLGAMRSKLIFFRSTGGLFTKLGLFTKYSLQMWVNFPGKVENR